MKQIDELTKNLRPVRPLAPRPAVAVAAALAGLGVTLAVLGPRTDLAMKLASPAFSFEMLALLVTGGLSLVAALRLRTPGARVPRWNRRALAVALPALLLSFALVLLEGMDGHGLDAGGWKCTVTTLVLTLASAAAGGWALRRGASTSPILSGTLLTLSALCFGWVVISADCAVDGAWHLAVWHLLLPVFGGGALGTWLGRRGLRW